MVDTLSVYYTNLLASMFANKIKFNIKRASSGLTGATSLMTVGNNNIITFPVIVSDDIPRDVVSDITKDVEVILAMATKNFIERKVNREASDLDIDSILNTLPFTNSNVREGISLMAEAVAIAGERLIKEHDIKVYGEASVEILREKGTLPTYINVRVPYIKGDKAGEIKTLEIQLGFEGIARFVPCNELVQRVGAFDNGRFYKSFVKLTKKEISFIGDFLLEIDNIKLAAKTAVKSDKLWRSLEMMNKKKDMFVKAYPFTTMIISDNVSDRIKNEYMLDLNDKRHTQSIMESFFTFALYEVNTMNSLVRVIKDGDADWKTTTIDDIVKNTSKIDRKIKELIKLG